MLFRSGHGLNKIEHRNEEIQMLYIEHNGEDFAIANIEEYVRAFNLKFHAAKIGQFTMKIKPTGNFSYLHMIDRMTGEDLDMLVEDDYTFIGTPNDNENRFVVRLRLSENDDNQTFAYQNGDEIVVDGDGELQIFDIMGRMVSSMRVSGSDTWNAASVPTGVYILRLIGDGVKTQKIVVE